MATHKIGCQGVGAVWTYALNLWVQFAQGSYTSWAFAMSTLNTSYAVNVTVGLPAGGTDVYKLQSLDTESGYYISLVQVFQSPGWRSMNQTVLPPTVPGGDTTDVSFLNGPWSMRAAMLLAWTNTSRGPYVTLSASASIGFEQYVVMTSWNHQNILMCDVIGCLFGTVTDVDELLGPTTDLLGAPPLIVSGGGGAAPDLAPVVAALEDIATMDVTYTANNGGAIWSMRGKVAAE